MMLFKLKCAAAHEFEGWFRDNATYDGQQARHEIACPVCGDTDVEKAPMAPRLARSLGSGKEPPPPAPAPQAKAPAPRPDGPTSPAELRRALQEVRRQVEAHCDYVGPRFAEEARRMHRGEAPARSIYGEASPADSRALADEGIEVAAIPWVPVNDA
jgi:hypothetical protein